MRVYITTSAAAALRTVREGFDDFHDYGTARGVWAEDRPPQRCPDHCAEEDAPAVFTLDVPESLFERHELTADGDPTRRAMLPAEQLNRCGRPLVYDHSLIWFDRREVVGWIRNVKHEAGLMEESDPEEALRLYQWVDSHRLLMELLDEVGWHVADGTRDAIKAAG